MTTDMTNRQITIPYLLKIGEGKIDKVGKYLFDKGMGRIALYWGEGMQKLLGARLHAGLAAHNINVVHEEAVGTVDIDAVTHAAFALGSLNAVVGIGGGKTLDFAKFAAHILKLPFFSIPTAISHDGFSSPSASLTVAGTRKSVKAGSPYGVVIDLDVIKNSPDVFLYSGVGDMMSKTTALLDWRTARDKGLARFVDLAAVLAYNSLDIMFLKHSLDIRQASFQRSLASSLTMSGLAMEIAGSSRPASGSEHLISHALDEVAKTPRMHGIQVGVATYLCALLQNNSHSEDIRIVYEETGFAQHLRDNPLCMDDFTRALAVAPSIKHNFYTVLSEEDSRARALEYLQTDGFLQGMVR